MSSMQESEPAPEGGRPVNAKAARIEHTLSTLEKLPESYKGAHCMHEEIVCSAAPGCV